MTNRCEFVFELSGLMLEYGVVWTFLLAFADNYLYQLLIDLHAYAHFGRYRRRASIEFMNINQKCVKINLRNVLELSLYTMTF